MKFKALDPGYHTQDYQLDGGMYGKFSLDLFTNEIIHNTTTGALTPYGGAGSNRLTSPITSGVPSNRNPATWNSFDYTVQRNQYGGEIKVDVFNPFYVNFSVAREDRSGAIPWSNGSGVEVPAPIKYETTNYMGEIGYRANPLFAAFNYTYGDFENGNQTLLIDGAGAQSGSTQSLMTLPPDNHFYKLGFKSVLQLPLNTRFNVSLSSEKDRSSFDLGPLLAFNNSFIPLLANKNTLNSSTFEGRKDVQNYAFSLTSNPIRFFDFKLYYKYYSTENNSTTIIQTIPGNVPPIVQAPLFDYKKNQYGADLGFKLPAQFRLNAAYAYIVTDRDTRSDIPSTKDSLYSAELRWTGLDFLTPKVGYEHLMRLADYGSAYALDGNQPPVANAGTTGHANFPQFESFDASRQRRDTYKVAVDASPLQDLNIGVAYKYKESKYPDDILGVQNTKTHELETYGDYLIGHIVKVNAYFDVQNTQEYLVDFNGTLANVGGTVIATPSIAPQYMWNTKLRDNTYEFGAGVDVYLVPKRLTLRVQYDYVNSDGTQDFSFLYPGAISGVNANTTGNVSTGPIGDPSLYVDSYRKSSLLCKLSYAISKSFTMAIGADFERYKYNDFAFSDPNYQYLLNLTGAYANPSYNASIGFVSVAYKF
jgi:MtrB/PioB family decaheme-associated outer membrane protein